MKLLLSAWVFMLLAACSSLPVGQEKAKVSGEAFYMERMAVPPDARLDVVLEDISRADAPAEKIASVSIQEVGQPPYPFTIEYDPEQIDPRHTYRLAARLYDGEKLLFRTDEVHQVITRGFPSEATLRMRRVVNDSTPSSTEDLPATFIGSFPATYTDTLPCEDCLRMDVHLNFLPGGAYILSEAYQGSDAEASFDIGRYLLSSDGRQLTLHGGREAPRRFERIDQDELRIFLLDRKGQRIEAGPEESLIRQADFMPLEPQLLLGGEYRYMAGAGRFKECLTGLDMPVASEGDNRALEEAYLAAQQEPGDAMKVSLEGRLVERMPVEGDEPVRTLVPERFIGVWPDQSCPPLTQRVAFKNTYWRLTLLGSEGVQREDNQREPHLVFNQDGRVSGADGCNNLTGAYTRDDASLTFSQLATTRKACVEGMRQAQTFLDTMATITSYQVIGNHLEMRDASGQLQLRFESVALL